jgi:hypothetical protein
MAFDFKLIQISDFFFQLRFPGLLHVSLLESERVA